MTTITTVADSSVSVRQTDSVADPKWKNIIGFSNVKINPLITALKLTLWLLLQYITARQILLFSFYGPVEHKDRNYTT